MKMLDRLRNSKGTLDTTQFEEFEKQQTKYLKNISETPMQFSSQPRSSSVIRSINRSKQQFFNQGNTTLDQDKFNSNQYSTRVNRSYINKDFTSGLKLPKTNMANNDSKDNIRLIRKSTELDDINQQTSRQENKIELSTFGITQQKRFKSNIRSKRENQNTIQESLQASGEYSFYDEQMLFKTKVEVQETKLRMNIEIIKKEKKIYIKAHNRSMGIQSELVIHLKQAIKLLMQFNNDFDLFINECLYFVAGKVMLRDINKINYTSIQQPSKNNELLQYKKNSYTPQLQLQSNLRSKNSELQMKQANQSLTQQNTIIQDSIDFSIKPQDMQNEKIQQQNEEELQLTDNQDQVLI